MPPGPFKNTLLQHLDPATIGRLQLRPVDLPLFHELETPGGSIEQIIFLEEGIGSMTTAFENGAQV